jgi:hypothetical protein
MHYRRKINRNGRKNPFQDRSINNHWRG